MAHPRLRLVLLLAFVATPASADVDYRRDVQPLLAAKCVGCHGPVKQEAGLRLDAGVLVRKGGDSGAVADPAAPEASLLLQRVASDSPEDRMPPASEGEPLKTEQIEILRQWIAAGLPSPADEPVLESARDHWAYRPVVRPELPAGGAGESPHPLDRLLARHHQDAGLTPLPPADPSTLLRRITFDLIGLPPTLAEQDRFLADSCPVAYARLVDELLARPQHGERWARHWMDVWRYSDWDGYKEELRSSQRHIWQWRDWIVESLNANKPYDRMLVEMLAGDELAPEDRDVLRGTGFLARSFHKSNRNIWLDATVEHTAKAFLGMTLNCARCHDHKYDPLAIGDYYAFRAIFEPHQVRTDRLPGEADVMKAGLPRAYDADLDAATYVYLRGDEKQPDKEHPVRPAVPDVVGVPFEIEAVPLPALASFPSLAEYVAQEDLAAAQARVVNQRKEWESATRASGGREPADSALASSRERPPSPNRPSGLNVEQESARRALRAAELDLASLEARWAADRCKHSGDDATPDQRTALAQQAAAAERAAGLAAAERDQWAALLKHRDAYVGKETDAKKRADAIQKAFDTLKKADEALAKAVENAAKTDDQYTAVGPNYPKTSTADARRARGGSSTPGTRSRRAWPSTTCGCITSAGRWWTTSSTSASAHRGRRWRTCSTGSPPNWSIAAGTSSTCTG
jgi:mono/diheme cytochrome c family protein